MKNGSFFVPREQLLAFMNPAEMKSCDGVTVTWETDPTVARRILPPPLELADPEHPLVNAYVVNIREPTFAPWYMEAAIMMFCRYRDKQGVHLVNLQLTGPGANMGLCSGRETSGLPKKLGERIVVERTGDWAHASVVAKGRRIFDVELELYPSDMPEAAAMAKAKCGAKERSSCFQYLCDWDVDAMAFSRARLLSYDSATVYQTFEPAAIKSIVMEPSLDDPWAELSVVRPIAANYSVYSNPIDGVSVAAEFEGAEADKLFPYLFTGKWDRSTICRGHQRYGQF